jgi:hypothetical protein
LGVSLKQQNAHPRWRPDATWIMDQRTPEQEILPTESNHSAVPDQEDYGVPSEREKTIGLSDGGRETIKRVPVVMATPFNGSTEIDLNTFNNIDLYSWGQQGGECKHNVCFGLSRLNANCRGGQLRDIDIHGLENVDMYISNNWEQQDSECNNDFIFGLSELTLTAVEVK